MKKIEAIIKPFKLSFVKEALHEVGISGMTVSDVKGFGRQRGSTGGIDNAEEYDDEFLVKMKLEVIVEEVLLEVIVDRATRETPDRAVESLIRAPLS